LTWPRKLVQTVRMLMGDEATAAEGFTRLTWEIAEVEPGVSKLTVIHDLEGAPRLAALVRGEMEDHGAGGGWPEVLSDLKTLLETGESLRG
jgi:activator of Hsp90 ATPase-like protein